MSDVRVSIRLGGLSLSFAGSESFFHRHVEGLLQGALHQAAASRGLDVPCPGTPEGGADDAGSEREPAGDGAAGGVLVDAVPKEERTLPPVEGYQPQSGHFAQFVRQVGDRAAQADQQLMAFGFYLWNYEKLEEFDCEQLAGCYRTLGIPLPEDLAERLPVLVRRKRFLQPGRAEGTYCLSNKGVNYVKNRLLAGD